MNADHAGYGYRRLAIALEWSVPKTRRLMAVADVMVLGVRRKRPFVHTTTAEPQTVPAIRRNLLRERNLTAAHLHHIWAEDFTHLWFQGRWYYLATVIDLYSRQAVGWSLSEHHDTDLITAALLDALSRYPPPAILHQDQGSEYCSERYDILAASLGSELSFSDKGSPWQNGFQESFYRPFKLELDAKHLDRFADLGQLTEAIAGQMHYYNTERIHSALNLPPYAFAVSGLPPANSQRHTALRAAYRDSRRRGRLTYWHQILTGVRDRVFGKVRA